MPSFNEITGARISSGVHVKGTDKEKFAEGWDRIFGKKQQEVLDEEDPLLIAGGGKPVYDKMSDGCCHKTVLERCEDCSFRKTVVEAKTSMNTDLKDWDETCVGYSSCPFCDNGYYPCNQNCALLA